MKKIIIFSLITLLIILTIEFSLRIFLGLGHPPLLVVDEEVGYYFKANQTLKRFGNIVSYNSHHQRSEELMKNRTIEY